MRHIVLAVLLSLVLLPVATAATMNDGDIIFQTSRSSQSLAVQAATGSKYSHMGIVFFRHGEPYVLEASATVRFTPFSQWVASGVNSHFVVKRLRNADDVLTPVSLELLRAEAEIFLGRQYDLTFEWTDDRIYCSELVWKAYDRSLGIQIGGLQKVRDFNLSDPGVKEKMRERYGNDVPLKEPVISPVAMFESPLLVTVLVQ